MTGSLRWMIVLAVGLAAYGQSASLSMPGWLIPYPDAAPKTRSSPAMVEARYVANANPDEVVGHFRKLFAEAGLKFVPNFDGIGTSIRAAAPECEILVQIRESSTGTAVIVSCAAGSTTTGVAPQVAVANSPSPGGSIAGQPQRSGAISQRAKRTGMSQYDKPVYPTNPAHPKARPYRQNDAPPLVWPAWFVPYGANAAIEPVKGVDQSKHQFLSSSYETNIGMSELHKFYQALFKKYGYKISKARLSTGQTPSGVMQNASGWTEASRSVSGRIHGPKTEVRVGYHRNRLNEPIKVRLKFTVMGSWVSGM